VNVLFIAEFVLLGDAFASVVAYIAGDHSDTYNRKLCKLSMLPYKTNIPGLR
jgi:hypothetical protein